MDQVACDKGRCSVPSLVNVVNLQLSTELFFCGHHYNVNRQDLLLQGFEIYSDNRLPGQRFEVIPEKEIKKVTTATPEYVRPPQYPLPPDDNPEWLAGAGA